MEHFLTLTLAIICASALGCGQATEPTQPEVPPFVGEWCKSFAVMVTRTGNDAMVTTYANRTTYRDVRRPSDGAIVRQEVRSCASVGCVFPGGANRTDDDLKASCHAQ